MLPAVRCLLRAACAETTILNLFLVGSAAPDCVPVRLMRVVVELHPPGTVPVATEVTSEDPV